MDIEKEAVLRNGESLRKELLQDINGTIRNLHSSGVQAIPSIALGLKFTDALEISRGDLQRSLLQKLVLHCVQRIPSLPINSLTDLLEKTYIYVNSEELRDIPINVLAIHPSPPSDLLNKILSITSSTFLDDLPPKAREKFMLADIPRFQQHMRDLISKHLMLATTIGMESKLLYHQSLSIEDMISTMQTNRYRSQNIGLIKISAAIGESPVLFHSALSIIRELFIQTKDLRLCTLRADLIMRYHDLRCREIYLSDACYRLACYVDIFLRARVPVPEKNLQDIFRELRAIDPTFTHMAAGPRPVGTRTKEETEAELRKYTSAGRRPTLLSSMKRIIIRSAIVSNQS